MPIIVNPTTEIISPMRPKIGLHITSRGARRISTPRCCGIGLDRSSILRNDCGIYLITDRIVEGKSLRFGIHCATGTSAADKQMLMNLDLMCR